MASCLFLFRSFTAVISVAAVFVFICPPQALVAQDLSVIRTAAKQRLSLLRTLDVRFRIWEDMEYRKNPDESPSSDNGPIDVHWISDRRRTFLERGSGGVSHRRIWYDGVRTVDFQPVPPNHLQPSMAFINRRTPKQEDLLLVILPQVLGVTNLVDRRDLETELSDRRTRVYRQVQKCSTGQEQGQGCPAQ